jgi:hypothetical protein
LTNNILSAHQFCSETRQIEIWDWIKENCRPHLKNSDFQFTNFTYWLGAKIWWPLAAYYTFVNYTIICCFALIFRLQCFLWHGVQTNWYVCVNYMDKLTDGRLYLYNRLWK